LAGVARRALPRRVCLISQASFVHEAATHRVTWWSIFSPFLTVETKAAPLARRAAIPALDGDSSGM
jgi:hypothetical protein